MGTPCHQWRDYETTSRPASAVVLGWCEIGGIRNVCCGKALCGISLGRAITVLGVFACALRDRVRCPPSCGSSEAAPITALLLERPFVRGVYGRGVEGVAKDDT